MTGDGAETIAPIDRVPRPTLGALFGRLIQEGEAFIRAEVRVYQAKAMRKAFSAGIIVAVFGGALMLLNALVVAILVGIILMAAPYVGTGWAILIVAAGTLVLLGILVLIGRARIKTLLQPEDAS